jgi:hypothetical protein
MKGSRLPSGVRSRSDHERQPQCDETLAADEQADDDRGVRELPGQDRQVGRDRRDGQGEREGRHAEDGEDPQFTSLQRALDRRHWRPRR